MIASILGIIREELHSMGIPYEFMRWTPPVKYPYFIGEFSETPTVTEDGNEEYSILLTGTTKNSWQELLDYGERIKDHFTENGAFHKATEKGVVVIFYENSFPVPTGEADLKRIQINLQIKSWKGTN